MAPARRGSVADSLVRSIWRACSMLLSPSCDAPLFHSAYPSDSSANPLATDSASKFLFANATACFAFISPSSQRPREHRANVRVMNAERTPALGGFNED